MSGQHEINPDDDDEAIAAALGEDPIKCGGRIRLLIEAIAYDGLSLDAAAERAGLPRRSAVVMLGMPRYRTQLRRASEVRHSIAYARSFHALDRIQSQERHLPAAVAAANAILRHGEKDAASAGAGSAPAGWVLAVIPAPQAGPLIEHQPEVGANPLKEQAHVRAIARRTHSRDADDVPTDGDA